MGLLQSRRRRVWEEPLDGARGAGGWRTPPVPRSPRTGSGWRCEAVQRVRGTGSAPGEVKRRPRDLPAAALLAERPAAARVCGRRLRGGLENQGRGALFVGRLGEAWACAPDKGGRRNPRQGLGALLRVARGRRRRRQAGPGCSERGESNAVAWAGVRAGERAGALRETGPRTSGPCGWENGPRAEALVGRGGAGLARGCGLESELLGPGGKGGPDGLSCWVGPAERGWARVAGLGLSLGWFFFFSISIYSLFPNLIQTKFEFKYKFEFKPHSNN